MGRFDKEFKIIVPKYSNDRERIDSDVLATYAKKMAEYFGGVTVNPSILGCWFDRERDQLVCEENLMLLSAFDASSKSESELERARDFVRNLAREIGKDLGQAAVMVVEDNIDRFEFVEGDYRREVPDYMKEHDFFKRLLD
ncbi:hypothetical protein DRP04_00185 [Archaeoglobales archaeon]|jgi:hypothetical protein|nr:MAG: hypothetical protein DRP04_00185 [Archaeoglobales archaeon]HDM76728.1 hypothetical protein [Deltaproteobacteria bacterium]